MLAVRRAVPGDVLLFTALARRTFHDAYAATAPSDQLAIHMARAFGVPQQAQELSDPGLVTLLAEVAGMPAGFAQVRIIPGQEVPPCVTGTRPIEVARFYLEQEWTGRGIAGPLMDAVLSEARCAGGTVAWLMVWEDNRRAIRFYERCGFREVGRAPYTFGERVELDWVMSMPLEQAALPGT